MVRFSRESRFDRVKSNQVGRSCFIDEDVVAITNPSGGVTLTKPVKQWFEEMRAKPHDWGRWEMGFRQMYADWQASHNVQQVDGTHVSNWPMLSPAQVEMLLNANVVTIEAASEMSDDLAQQLDGGTYIRAKARFWIRAAEDMGAITSEVASLKAENDTLKATNATLGETVAQQRTEIQRLERLITGKDGFDVVAGRVKEVPSAAVRASEASQQPVQTAPLQSSTSIPQASKRLSYDEAASLGAMALREYCYERNVKPAITQEDTLAGLVAVGEIDAPVDLDASIADEPEASPPRGKARRGK